MDPVRQWTIATIAYIFFKRVVERFGINCRLVKIAVKNLITRDFRDFE